MIANQLGETEEYPRQQIIDLVRVLGRTQARALLEQTLEIEANGGMLTKNKKQKRTIGGIFFHLAYTTGTPKEGKVLKKLVPRKPKKVNQPAQPEGEHMDEAQLISERAALRCLVRQHPEGRMPQRSINPAHWKRCMR